MNEKVRMGRNMPGNASIVLSKAEASLRHIESAIIAFEEGRFDVAITLAGAAEGMAPKTAGPALFTFLRDHPRISAEGVGKTEWIDILNVERNWLKHDAASHPTTMEFDRSSAAIMLIRAISGAQPAFGFQSDAIDNFRRWVIQHTDDLFSGDARA